MLLHESFEASARRLPDKTALVAGSQRLSYRALHARVLHLVRRLRAAGVGRGDRVVLLLEPDAHYAVALHAVLRAGAVVVPLMPTTKSDKLRFVLQETEAVALLADSRLRTAWAPLRSACTSLRCVVQTDELAGDGEALAGCADIEPCAAIDQDLAALIYTSGSTGRPKGVMLTHHNMVSAWRSVQSYLQLREDDVIGLALPPVFSYGLYHLLMGLGIGATVVLEAQAAFPVKVAQMLERERVTVMPGVPTLFAALLGLSQLAQFDHRSLRLLSNAAAALPVSHIERIRCAWPQARLFSMYGMTECKRISYLPPEELERRPGSVGRGMPNQEHWLVDEQQRRLAHGSVGELVVRGSHVMRGYWRRPQETAERLRAGPNEGEAVLHTGDLFRSDAEGYLYFIARMDDIIKTRGEKVAPREIEDVIHEIEGVTGCAVVGVADEVLGQAIHAYVTLDSESLLSERDIVRHCQAKLESHMVPRQVRKVDELPKTESGKVRHAALRGESDGSSTATGRSS
ncbi:MAG: acyl--CoA ligase [Rubrivivax sp.]|nr:acyl--CoA ligase [Rubrivivax sp.]